MHDPFEGVLSSGDERLDENCSLPGALHHAHCGRFQQPADSLNSIAQLVRRIGADDPTACRQPERLDDTGEL